FFIEVINHPGTALVHVYRAGVCLRVSLFGTNRTQDRSGFAIDDLHGPRTGITQTDHRRGMLFMGPVPTGWTTTEISGSRKFFHNVSNMVRLPKVTGIIRLQWNFRRSST